MHKLLFFLLLLPWVSYSMQNESSLSRHARRTLPSKKQDDVRNIEMVSLAGSMANEEESSLEENSENSSLASSVGPYQPSVPSKKGSSRNSPRPQIGQGKASEIHDPLLPDIANLEDVSPWEDMGTYTPPTFDSSFMRPREVSRHYSSGEAPGFSEREIAEAIESKGLLTEESPMAPLLVASSVRIASQQPSEEVIPIRDEVIEGPSSISSPGVTSPAGGTQILIPGAEASVVNTQKKTLWQRVKGAFVKKEYLEGAVLTGFMTFFGWYYGGNEGDYNYPELVNAFAGLTGGNIADMVEMQSFISKFIKIGVPMTTAYVINHFGFQDINPYAGNTFFFALCFAAMLELKLMSARIKGVPAELKTRYIPLQRKLVDLLGYKENDSTQEKATKIAIAQRIIQTAEFAVLAGSATGLGVAVEKMSGALGAAAYAFASLPTFFVGIASGNVGEMSEGLAYWKRSLWLLPAATATWAINQFALDGARPEIPYMLLFAWVGLTFKEIKQKIGLEEEKHSEGPRAAASVIR